MHDASWFYKFYSCETSHQPAKPRLVGAEKLHEITTFEAGRAVTEARHQKDSVLYVQQLVEGSTKCLASTEINLSRKCACASHF